MLLNIPRSQDPSNEVLGIEAKYCSGGSRLYDGTADDYLSVYQSEWFLRASRYNLDFKSITVSVGGVQLGYLPYSLVQNKAGLLWGGVSHWGHLAGPVLRAGLSPQQQSDVMDKLVASLPRHVRFKFVCRPNALLSPVLRQAFVRAGFEESHSPTFLFPADDPGMLSRLNKRHRNNLRAASRNLSVFEITSGEFIEFYRKNLSATDRKSYEPLEVAQRIAETGSQLGTPKVRILAARKLEHDSNGAGLTQPTMLDAAAACLMDERYCYLWMLTYRKDSQDTSDKPHPDAVKLLIWNMAEYARNHGLVFDLDGVGSTGTEHFYETVIKAPVKVYRSTYRRQRFIDKMFLYHATRHIVLGCLTTLTGAVSRDSRFGYGHVRAGAGWPGLPRRRSAT